MLFNKRNEKTIRGIKWTISILKDEDDNKPYYEAYAIFADGSIYLEASTYEELLQDINAEIDYHMQVTRRGHLRKIRL